MKLDYDGLKAAIGRLSQGTSAHSDLLFLVRVSRAVVEAYLRVKMHSLRYLYANQGLTETDLAYDCIAEVFRVDGEGHYPKLERFAASLSAPFDETPSVGVFVAWRGLLVRVAKGRVAEIFHLVDPVGGRIHRNLRDCARKFTDLRVIDSPSGLCICIEPPPDSPKGTGYPADALEQELASRADHDGDTTRVLGHVRDLLAADRCHGGRVRLFDLVQVVKRRFGAGLSDPADHSTPAVEGLTEADILALRERCLTSVKEKIFLTYLGKGKLTRREATALFDAVAGVVDDWIAGIDGGRPLAGRLADILPLGEEEYASRYRAKLEYLVMAAREEFAALLSREI
jgi:hypothetical protein